VTLIHVRVAILQVLITGDAYGLEVIDRIRAGTGGLMLPQQGRVYPALRELEAEGLLESYASEPLPERGGRSRIYYRLTADGRRVARQQARAMSALLRPALDGAR
jgi:PadR family transcriptional regulator PadR